MTTNSIYHELIQKIHWGVNPYEGFYSTFPPHILEGWDSDHHWFGECIERIRPQIIIEVGSFLGASAIHMAGHLKRLGLESAIICVDTWLAERQLWTRKNHRRVLQFVNGRPTVYNSFIDNVIDVGMQDIIIPLSMDSRNGARYLEMLEVTADMIYIDGGHDGGDVYCDLDLYWGRLQAGGIMLIDDYVPNTNNNEMFHGLIRDVEKFSGERGLKILNDGRKAMLEKIN